MRRAIASTPSLQGVHIRYLTLLASAAVLTIVASAANAEVNTAPGGSGVVQSSEGKGATNKDTTTVTPMGSKTGDATGKEPGTGVEDSVQGEGATNKAGMPDAKEGKATNMGGPSSGTAMGGTGVEHSAEGKGETNKN